MAPHIRSHRAPCSCFPKDVSLQLSSEQPVGDVGITQLDWKRVPQARSRGCKSSVAITAQCTVRGTTQVETCREQALGGAEDPRDSLQFIGCRRRGLYTRRISVETAAQFPVPLMPFPQRVGQTSCIRPRTERLTHRPVRQIAWK